MHEVNAVYLNVKYIGFQILCKDQNLQLTTTIWCFVFKAESLAVCKDWVKIAQVPVIDRPPKLASLSFCGAQLSLPPTQDYCSFQFEGEVLTSEVLTHEATRKENFCCCCSGQSRVIFIPQWLLQPVHGSIKWKSAKVLNTSNSCWLTPFGVESIQIVFPLLSYHQQKFPLHQTRLVTSWL